MGSEIRVLVPRARIRQAVRIVEGVCGEWEDTLSRFRPGSELSRLNAAAGATRQVGRILLAAVIAAREGARSTGGLFDPLLQGQLVRLGYDRPFEEIDDPEPLATPLVRGGGWRSVVIDEPSSTVTLPAGHGLDLGGIGKGLAVDESVTQLAGAGIAAALVSAGGDLRVLGLPPSGRWDIVVGDVASAPVVPLAKGALATSGTDHRAWYQGRELRHHLVDPRTGGSARSGLRQVTVAASTCGAAEVAATAAFVAGPRIGRRLLERYRLAGLLVTDGGLQIPVGRWPVHGPARAA